jgi:Xaa-Pro aminopeptidase
VQLIGVDGAVERLRAIKDAEEISRIRSATVLADAAFMRLIADGLVGRTEREVAIALENDMRARGAQRPSFETIVAAGPHGALPHAQPRDVPIAAGELVVIDWGAELDGYCSDCTRTVSTGEVGREAVRAYELVLKAQLAGVAAVRGGASGRDVDAAARAVIDAGGQREHFGHGLGHGVGTLVHEAPRLSQRSEDVLAAGNVVTVEPGVYLPGRFGIRIEDLVVVDGDGCDVLTSVPKRLLRVG